MPSSRSTGGPCGFRERTRRGSGSVGPLVWSRGLGGPCPTLSFRYGQKYSIRSGYTAAHVSYGEVGVLSGALFGFGLLQAVIYLLFIRAIDLYEREPLRYVIPVFVWGFAVATTVSLIFNTLFQ